MTEALPHLTGLSPLLLPHRSASPLPFPRRSSTVVIGLSLSTATTGLPSPLIYVHRTSHTPTSRPDPLTPRQSAHIAGDVTTTTTAFVLLLAPPLPTSLLLPGNGRPSELVRQATLHLSMPRASPKTAPSARSHRRSPPLPPPIAASPPRWQLCPGTGAARPTAPAGGRRSARDGLSWPGPGALLPCLRLFHKGIEARGRRRPSASLAPASGSLLPSRPHPSVFLTKALSVFPTRALFAEKYSRIGP
ncbi:wiskott-Aldrich syndrome protein homolog 1-like [Triticum dicoccoides]|uniref:wiskott-Aldrich syndrome protein homolog 1-like n=1 Tax=Triticum dicoccoides TaxID=85692 RepID=UPI00188FDE54|nr:wiskott-Aldrich syndrome protein homolog 1-like [Triticum dicoccoides]